jgi:hypothetical protein
MTRFIAAGFTDNVSTARLISLQPRLTVEKTTDWIPWSIALSPDGLGLAVGERDNGVVLYCRN